MSGGIARAIRLLGALFLLLTAVGLALFGYTAAVTMGLGSIETLSTGALARPVRWIGALPILFFPFYLIVGVGLLREAIWARVLALGVAAVSALSFPVGTLLALVSFGVLMHPDAKRRFDPLARAASAVPPGGSGGPGVGEPPSSAAASATAPARVPANAGLGPASPDTAATAASAAAAPAGASGAEHAPEPLAVLRYRLTAEDCVAAAEYQLAHSPVQRRSLLLNAAAGSVLVVALLFALRLAGRPVGWMAGFVAVVGWLVYLPWRLRVGNRRHFRKLYAEAEANGFMGEHRLAVDGGGVTVQNRIGSSRILWPGIQRIVTGPGFAVLELSSQNVIIVPARGILDGDLDTFVELARRLRAEAGAVEA